MFTATIIDKQKVDGILALTVRFTDGVDTLDETVKPQDEDGLKYFVKARLDSLNTSKKLETEDNIGRPIEIDPVVPVETAEQVYYRERYKLIEIKQDVELGLATQKNFNDQLAIVRGLKT